MLEWTPGNQVCRRVLRLVGFPGFGASQSVALKGFRLSSKASAWYACSTLLGTSLSTNEYSVRSCLKSLMKPKSVISGTPRIPTVSQTPMALIGIFGLVRPACIPHRLATRAEYRGYSTYLNQTRNVARIRELRSTRRPFRSTVGHFVSRIHLVLPIIEDAVERAQPFPCQETDITDQATNASSREGASREADKYDLIAFFIILRPQSVSLVLGFAFDGHVHYRESYKLPGCSH